jgi:Zn-dependent protease
LRPGRVLSITLFLFGGVAEIRGELRTPATEFAVALVGPAVSILLGGAFGLAAERAEGVVAGVLLTLALVNLGVGVFNLVPGLPLDGGRLLRAGLWRLTGSYARATRVAAAGGRVVAAAPRRARRRARGHRRAVGLWYVPMGGVPVAARGRQDAAEGRSPGVR